jgi:hypothetical protein
LNPSSLAQSVDLSGWNLRTEQSGSFLCEGNRWQQVELLSGTGLTWEGTYTAARRDAQTIEIKAEPEFETTRTWVLHFEDTNAGTYTLDYVLFDDYTIHEEGRFYNSQVSLWYADWAQMTGQTQNGPEQVWQYLTGESTPIVQPEVQGGLLQFRVPIKLSGRSGVIEREESPDLSNWASSTGPIQISGDRKRFFRLKARLNPQAAMRPGPAVGIGSATLVPGTMTKVSGLTTVQSLEISTRAGSPTKIEVTETAKPEASALVQPLTGLIGIEGLEAMAATPIEVRVNVRVPKDTFAMGFIFDRNSGRFEGMPLQELAEDHVTVFSRHFCEFLILKIPIADLPEEVDSGFRPGTDDWEFTNYGSYIEPGGHCAGQAISAMYYFVTQRQKGNVPQLYAMWDNPGNDWATPTIGTDNERGYALASMVQHAIDWDSFANGFWWNLSPGDLNTYRAFVFAMWITGEPQAIGIYRDGGGHALVAWKCAYRSIHVADPNYPGNDTRWINFNSISNRFDPYYSGPTAADLGRAYPTILYYGKTTMVDWNQVGTLWEQAKTGTIGSNDFPFVTLTIINDDKTVAGIVTNSMTGGIKTIPITGSTFAFGGLGWDRLDAYKPDGSGWEVHNGWFTAEGETNRVGLDLTAKVIVGTNSTYKWVGFQWLDITHAQVTPVTIAISPVTTTLMAGETQSFSATVAGTSKTNVDWSIQEGGAGGTITAAGLYTAPETAGTYHVLATSQAQPTAFATATITVQPAPAITKFSNIEISAHPALGPACSGASISLSSEGTIPVLWSANRFSVDGTKDTTNAHSVVHATVSISGTVNADGTISLAGTSHTTQVEEVGFGGDTTDLTETTTSITLDRVPRSPLFLDSIHWLAYRASDRPSVKAVNSVSTVTRKVANGPSEVRSSCTVTDVDWQNFGVVQVNGG